MTDSGFFEDAMDYAQTRPPGQCWDRATLEVLCQPVESLGLGTDALARLRQVKPPVVSVGDLALLHACDLEKLGVDGAEIGEIYLALVGLSGNLPHRLCLGLEFTDSQLRQYNIALGRSID